MNIHEYQAKDLFNKYQVPTGEGSVAENVDDAVKAAESLGKLPIVVKAQIHAGGRGKGGGVKIANTLEEVREHAENILGMNLVTPQTGPEGKLVKKILVAEALDIAKELYLSVIYDRSTANIVIMASLEGGVDIEEVADKTPEKIIKVQIDPLLGIQPFHCRHIVYGLNLGKDIAKQLMGMLGKLYKLFVDYDCSIVEINPLIITTDEKVVALDAKVNFDDNALFRHKDIMELRDEDEMEPLEVEASTFNLNYIKMEGNIGNMVNGAGLAMATMDIIKRSGAEPANFLDVGGGANAEMIENGFRIILSDKNVKGILINIFGGILRCDILANGVVEAAKKLDINVPVVIRMEGTNVDEGRKILAESGMQITTAVDLKDAAEKIAAIAKK